MLKTSIKYATWAMMIILVTAIAAIAGDLDDSIEIDDKLEKYDKLDRPGINIQYIKRSAKASATGTSRKSKGNGDVAIGGFINKPGAKVGDVTIIFEGKDIKSISE